MVCTMLCLWRPAGGISSPVQSLQVVVSLCVDAGTELCPLQEQLLPADLSPQPGAVFLRKYCYQDLKVKS